MENSNGSYNSNVLFSIQMILAQYPILQDRISEAMFNKLVEDGYTTFPDFEERVRDFALMSQRREGLQNPFAQEGPNVWENRLNRVRAQLINVEFSQHYPLDFFSDLVNDIVQNQVAEEQPVFMWHNLQFAPLETIIEQALIIERLPPAQRKQNESKLMGAKTALIRRLINDQLPYIQIAKKVFSIQDLIEINKHRIGRGCIGGKAAGMILARRILQDAADEEIRSSATTKETFYIGAEEFYTFLSINDKLDLLDFRYEDEAEYWARYPEIQKSFETTTFPKEIIESLERVVRELRGRPFIVRSSSRLEDGFRYSLTGLYDSQVVPNQGSVAEGLTGLLNAIRKIYANAFDPRVLSYRLCNGLIDFQESLAILIQVITGNKNGNYLFPDISGVGASKSPFRWQGNSSLYNEDSGFIRVVCGMGTRAIQRNAYDFPQIVVLNEPGKSRSVFSVDDLEFSQESIDVINLKTNQFESLEIPDVINEKYPLFPWVAQVITQEGTLQPIMRGAEPDRFVLNFSELIRKSSFTRLMRDILATLERAYQQPVMIEFTMMTNLEDAARPTFQIQIDKCRPINIADRMKQQYAFEEIAADRKLLETDLYVQNGLLENVQYVLDIDAAALGYLNDADQRQLTDFIRAMNKKMANENFILVGNDRFGTKDHGRGIAVNYSDICNAKVIVEISNSTEGKNADPIAGTKFYQNLLEAGIYTISINLERETNLLNRDFFENQPNKIWEWIEVPERLKPAVKLLPVNGYRDFSSLKLAFNQAQGKATAYFA